jgi:putative toxin-antitoxin system antitoxin component (TIGR02293 family)
MTNEGNENFFNKWTKIFYSDKRGVHLGKMSSMEKGKLPLGYKIEEDDAAVSTAEEPVQHYISNRATQPVLAWRVLGGKAFTPKVPDSAFSFYQAGVDGIPKSSVASLATVLKVPMTDMADLLNVSYKTLGRKANHDLLDGWISSHSIEIAQTVARGLSLFEDEAKLNRWLHKPNKALKGKIPFEMFKYPTGIKLVNQIMGRIEEGIYT